ncbi:MAG: hypothetical protein JXB34_02895 [Bacteroidales bacterium]|nr:hypothetical protein [Bacteroidales bacterium]
MKPLNNSERNKAIFRFVILLTITIVIIIMAIFFDHRVPTVENRYLRSQIKNTERLIEQEEIFAKKMGKIKSLIDSMGQKGVNSDYIGQLISANLAEMQTSLPSDSTFRHAMYINIIQTYLELKNAKASLIGLGDVQKELEEYSLLVDKYRADLEQVHRDLDLCRQLRNQ